MERLDAGRTCGWKYGQRRERQFRVERRCRRGWSEQSGYEQGETLATLIPWRGGTPPAAPAGSHTTHNWAGSRWSPFEERARRETASTMQALVPADRDPQTRHRSANNQRSRSSEDERCDSVYVIASSTALFDGVTRVRRADRAARAVQAARRRGLPSGTAWISAGSAAPAAQPGGALAPARRRDAHDHVLCSCISTDPPDRLPGWCLCLPLFRSDPTPAAPAKGAGVPPQDAGALPLTAASRCYASSWPLSQRRRRVAGPPSPINRATSRRPRPLLRPPPVRRRLRPPRHRSSRDPPPLRTIQSQRSRSDQPSRQ